MRLIIVGCVLCVSSSICLAGDGASETDAAAENQPMVKVVQRLDGGIPKYRPLTEPIRGKLIVTCSGLTEPLIGKWSNVFQTIYPATRVSINREDFSFDIVRNGFYEEGMTGFLFEGDGQSVMLDEDREFKWPVVVGFDRLEVIVHPANTVKKLSLDELAWIISNQGRSEPKVTNQMQSAYLDHPRIGDWRDLGDGRSAFMDAAPIHVYRKVATTATSDDQFFLLQTMGNDEIGFKAYFSRLETRDFKEVGSDQEMIKAIRSDRYGIGYVSHSLFSDRVRSVPIEGRPEALWPMINEVPQQPFNLKVPCLVRPLYFWVRPGAGQSRPKLEAEFLKFVLSQQGQAAVSEKGFFPLPAGIAQSQLQAAIKTPVGIAN